MAEIKYLDLTGLQRYDQKIKEVVNTGLDAKIGKDDAMLSVMMGSETIQATATGSGTYFVIPTNDYWEVEFTEFPYGVSLFECVDGAPSTEICSVLDYGDGKLTNDNGKVVASQFAWDEYQIDTNKEYALKFIYGEGEANFTITLGKGHNEQFNVQQSISYLNENKADKSEVELSLALKANKSDIDALDLGVKEIYLGYSDLGDVVRLHDTYYHNPDPDASLDHGYVDLVRGSVYFSKINHDGEKVLIGNVVGFEDKIGKDDVMLGSEELLSSWTGNGLLETPYMTNNWSARVEGMGGEYIPTTIYNENDEVIFVLPSFEELGARGCPITCFIYTHNNGELSILVELMDAPKNYTANIQIDPTSTYKLVFGDNAYYVKLTGDIYAELPTNTKKSFEKLNKSIVRFDSEIKELDENKADKISFNQHVLQFYELKGNVRDIESSLALKADKAEVESSLALKADKTSTENAISNLEDTKIGKDDEMLIVSFEPTTNTTTYSGSNYFYTSLFKGNNWTVECTLNHDNDLINFILFDQDEVFNKELGSVSKKLILTNDNGTLTINKNGQISTIAIDPSKSYKLYTLDISLYPTSHVDVTITQGGDTILNTQKSLSYLNENKADKSDIKEILLGERDLGDSVIFHDNDSVKDTNGAYGGIPLEPGYVYFSTISEFDNVDGTYDKKLIGIVAGFDSKANSWDIPTSVSQLSNDAGYAVAGDLKIAEVTEGLGENVAKAYKFEGGAESAVIEIPKDQTLKSVELGKIVDDAFVVDPTGEILRFTYIIADGSEKVVDVNVSNLITEAELDPVYDLIDTKLNAADVLTVSNDEIDAMFA